MSKQLDIKVTLPDGTEQLNIATRGQTLRIKAVANAKYQVIDAQTGKAPEKLQAKRVGKYLLIQSSDDLALDSEVVIEDFTDTQGVSLVGQGSDGTFYEYIPQTASDTNQGGALALDQDVVYALSQSPLAASALVGAPLFAPSLAAAVTGAGVAAGTVLANSGTESGADPLAAEKVKTAVSAISKAAQLNDAETSNTGVSVYSDAGVTGVTAANVAAMNSVLNSKSIDGAAVDSTPKIQAMVNAMTAVLLSAGSGPAATLEQFRTLGLEGVDASNLAQLQAAIRRTADDGSEVDSMSELQGLLKDVVSAIHDLSATAQDNTAAPTQPSSSAYTRAGVSGVDSSNLAAINSALNTSAITGDKVDTPAEIQELVDTYKAILAAADGQGGNASIKPSASQYTLLGLTNVDSALKANLLGEVIDRKTSDAVDSIDELQLLADAVNAVDSF